MNHSEIGKILLSLLFNSSDLGFKFLQYFLDNLHLGSCGSNGSRILSTVYLNVLSLVGSTSIEGMPGTKFPDALLIIPEFPPSKPIIQVNK